MDGSDAIKACDHCQHNFDEGDIYPVDGEELCENCKKLQETIKNPSIR